MKIAKTVSDISFEKIANVVMDYYGIQMDQLMSKSRRREAVISRFIIMYLMKKLTNMNLVAIRKIFGKNHATVIHAIKTIDNYIETKQDILNPGVDFAEKMKDIENSVIEILTQQVIKEAKAEEDNVKTEDESVEEPIEDNTENFVNEINGLKAELVQIEHANEDLKQEIEALNRSINLYKRKLEYANLPFSSQISFI